MNFPLFTLQNFQMGDLDFEVKLHKDYLLPASTNIQNDKTEKNSDGESGDRNPGLPHTWTMQSGRSTTEPIPQSLEQMIQTFSNNLILCSINNIIKDRREKHWRNHLIDLSCCHTQFRVVNPASNYTNDFN